MLARWWHEMSFAPQGLKPNILVSLHGPTEVGPSRGLATLPKSRLPEEDRARLAARTGRVMERAGMPCPYGGGDVLRGGVRRSRLKPDPTKT